MAGDLIDAYVVALHEHLAWRDDVQEVVDEVVDHLREHAERLAAQGVPAEDAQRRTLECFGDLGVIARAFARTPSGGLAVPTRLTRQAGLAGIGAAFAWPLAAVAGLAGGSGDLLVPWRVGMYQVMTTVLVAAMALTGLTLAGGIIRSGRTRGATSIVALVVCALLTLSLLAISWAVSAVSAVLGVVALVALRGDLGAATGVVRPLRALGVWPVALACTVVFDEIVPIGPVDSYGDHPVAWVVPFVVAAVVTAAGVGLAGVRLRAERAADLPHHDVPATPLGT